MEKWKEAFEEILKMKNPYLLLEKLLEGNSDMLLDIKEDKYDEDEQTHPIIEHLMDSLDLFVEKDFKGFVKFAEKHLIRFTYEIIPTLYNKPDKLMEYLEAIYKSKKDDKKFLEIYLKSLSKINPKNAEERILKKEFPLSISSKIAEEFNYNSALSYVYVKRGIPERGVQVLVRDYTLQRNPKDKGLPAFLQKVLDIFQKIYDEDQIVETATLIFSFLKDAFQKKIDIKKKEIIENFIKEIAQILNLKLDFQEFLSLASSSVMLEKQFKFNWDAEKVLADQFMELKIEKKRLSNVEDDAYHERLNLVEEYNQLQLKGVRMKGRCISCRKKLTGANSQQIMEEKDDLSIDEVAIQGLNFIYKKFEEDWFKNITENTDKQFFMIVCSKANKYHQKCFVKESNTKNKDRSGKMSEDRLNRIKILKTIHQKNQQIQLGLNSNGSFDLDDDDDEDDLSGLYDELEEISVKRDIEAILHNYDIVKEKMDRDLYDIY